MACGCQGKQTEFEATSNAGESKTFKSMAEARAWVAAKGGGSFRTVTVKANA